MKRRIEEIGERLLIAAVLGALMLSPAIVKALDVGDVAPDFSLLGTSGTTISLSQFKGKQAVLLEFYVADLGVT